MVGRPRKLSVEDSLARALTVFWEKGYAATSMSDLSAALEVGPSSLYNTFGSKAELFDRCMQAYVDEHGAFLRDTLAGADVPQALRQLLRGSVVHYTRPCSPRGCAVINAGPDEAHDPEVATLLCGLREGTLQAIADAIQRGVDTRQLPAETDVPGLARYVLAVVQGISLQARDGAAPEALHTIAEAGIRGLGLPD